jgi:tagatose 1,6-diphosphate aldolase
VKSVGFTCKKYDIAFLLEPVSHSIEGGPQKKQHFKEFSQQKPWVVIETAKELTKPEYGVDVLKAEFPLNLRFAEELRHDPTEICHQLDEASQIPWVILSAGVDYEEFRENLKYAVIAGASGFLCGRAIWKEAIGRKNRDIFLRKTSVRRLNRLVEIVEKHARPWYTKYVDSLQEINVIRGE